jgi:hypothetical protein
VKQHGAASGPMSKPWIRATPQQNSCNLLQACLLQQAEVLDKSNHHSCKYEIAAHGQEQECPWLSAGMIMKSDRLSGYRGKVHSIGNIKVRSYRRLCGSAVSLKMANIPECEMTRPRVLQEHVNAPCCHKPMCRKTRQTTK